MSELMTIEERKKLTELLRLWNISRVVTVAVGLSLINIALIVQFGVGALYGIGGGLILLVLVVTCMSWDAYGV